ncbi:MAG: hypothetical protein ACRDSE_21335, partial [Pseudonocardiaceae bacterium]
MQVNAIHGDTVLATRSRSSSTTIIAALGIRITYCSNRTPSGNSTDAMLSQSRRLSSTTRSPWMIHRFGSVARPSGVTCATLP